MFFDTGNAKFKYNLIFIINLFVLYLDKKGYISLAEFSLILRDLNLNISKLLLEQFVDSLDLNSIFLIYYILNTQFSLYYL